MLPGMEIIYDFDWRRAKLAESQGQMALAFHDFSVGPMMVIWDPAQVSVWSVPEKGVVPDGAIKIGSEPKSVLNEQPWNFYAMSKNTLVL
jgi:hypothetical protein